MGNEAINADRRLASAAEQLDGYISLALARSVGMSEAQIRARVATQWHRVHEGVYRLPGVPKTWRGEVRAAVWAAGEDAAASHRTAAALYDVPGRRTDLIEVTCRRWERARHPGIVVHEHRRLPPIDVTEHDGIRVVTPEMLLVQLAWMRPFPDFLESVIHALRRRRLISYDSAKATFGRHARRGLRGVCALRVALERWNPGGRPTESEMETMLLQAVRAHGLPEPELQHEIIDESGRFVARVEGAFPGWRIAYDYDSMQEHLDEFQLARDSARRNRIAAAGWTLLTARHGDLRNGGFEFCRQLHAAARRQSA